MIYIYDYSEDLFSYIGVSTLLGSFCNIITPKSPEYTDQWGSCNQVFRQHLSG